MAATTRARPDGRVRVGSIVIRCTRFEEAQAFWEAALGYAPREPAEDGWVVLADPTGRGPNISLERVEVSLAPAPGERSAIHLDLYATDQAAEVERLVGLGATRYAQATAAEDDFVVLVDPAGYRFCVVQT